ncbi:hypothetical protein ATO6_03945 [Oceanicola sp. 22II-s10i]|uniref:hypothetical protein n=1 Tax=Oceanicola sp. 22II-s10i TaxID=1317116 RepID=UPI000B524E07|nr:hypothetical protein [Oceanicola sp. 22II-s10i]OWU86030.1 hypothetical protein ATO6_03945 [Oceanicola sp. 22II-s10i]
MAKSSKVLIAAGTIGTAAAVGFLMQIGRDAPAPQAAFAVSEFAAGDIDTAPLARTVEVADELPVSDITLTSSDRDPEPSRPVALPPVSPKLATMSEALPDTLPNAPRVDEACPITMTATPTIAALVDLSFSSKCDPYTRVTFHHAGISFTELTDSMGQIELTVPALAETARFTAEIAAGGAAVAITTVDSLIFYDRAVVFGQGTRGVALHALEFGAGFDDEGHVSADAPRDPVVASRGEGGFLMVLGDPTLSEGRFAQVYTFPSGMAKTGGDIDLFVEVEVLDGTCGRDLTAQTVQVNGGVRRPVQDIQIAMPDCDAVGDYLVLKTPLDDLTIAMK